MNKIMSLVFLFILFGCKKTNVFVSEKAEFDRIDSLYLKEFNAENPKFSLLIFGQGYFNSTLKVENCQELKPIDSIKYLKFGPFAKIYKIDNTCRTNVQDFKRNHLIEFKKDSTMKYKFIYVERGIESDSLKILFEKNHLQVK